MTATREAFILARHKLFSTLAKARHVRLCAHFLDLWRDSRDSTCARSMDWLLSLVPESEADSMETVESRDIISDDGTHTMMASWDVWEFDQSSGWELVD